MGSELINVGGLGMGICVKFINNYMSIVFNVFLVEVVVLCEVLNFFFDVVVKVMSGIVVGKGYFIIFWLNKVFSGDFFFVFMIDFVYKDFGIVFDVVNQLYVLMLLGVVLWEVYSQVCVVGCGCQDWFVILEQVCVSVGMIVKVKM